MLALEKVRLGAGAPPIGIPFFWPSAAMPNTVMDEWSDMVFLKWNGATFSAETYPKLAMVIPSLTLIEARGEFPRIWDDGRGVDNGRTLLSAQGDAIRNITGTVQSRPNSSTIYGALFNPTGVFNMTRGTGDSGSPLQFGTSTVPADTLSIDISRSVQTASENRPRNISFNFLVRAK